MPYDIFMTREDTKWSRKNETAPLATALFLQFQAQAQVKCIARTSRLGDDVRMGVWTVEVDADGAELCFQRRVEPWAGRKPADEKHGLSKAARCKWSTAEDIEGCLLKAKGFLPVDFR